MNETNRNGHGPYTGYPEAAMMPATYGPAQYQPCGPGMGAGYGPAYGAYTCAEAYESEKHMMMCDVCDMLHDIKGIVSDTNKMVRCMYQRQPRDPERATAETQKK